MSAIICVTYRHFSTCPNRTDVALNEKEFNILALTCLKKKKHCDITDKNASWS